MGTANFLVGLGASAYLEIIGPDPDQPQPVGGRWLGIDRLTAPRIVTWAIRTADIDGSVAAEGLVRARVSSRSNSFRNF
jgi:hypothetical protein